MGKMERKVTFESASQVKQVQFFTGYITDMHGKSPLPTTHCDTAHMGKIRARCLKIMCSYQHAKLKDVKRVLTTISLLQELNNQYLLISYTTKTHMYFSVSPQSILCNLHLKVQKEKPMFHYLETAAPNVITAQFRPQLQRLITLANEAEVCHFPLAPKRFYSLSNLRIVLSPPI